MLDFLVNCFSSCRNFEKVKESEDMEYYSAEFSFDKYCSPNSTKIKKAFDILPQRDSLSIHISMDGIDFVKLSNHSEIKAFNEEVESQFLSVYDEESIFTLQIKIYKSISDNLISFYSDSLFKKMILSKGVEENLNFFDSLIRQNGNIHFYIIDSSLKTNSYCYTDSICISWNNNKKDSMSFKPIQINRKGVLDKRNKVCNPTNLSKYHLIPNDFQLTVRSDKSQINDVFDKITFFLSLSFICDITSLKSDEVSLKINGYRPISGVFNLESSSEYSLEVFNVFNWIYSDGNLSDKIGLARNIISLNIKGITDILSLSSSVLGSITSGYEIYLKENVQQYIDVKNKVSEFLINKSLQSTELVRSFTNSLKNNNFVFLTFFMSYVVFRVLSSDNTSMFTREISYLAYAIFIISFIYLIISIIFINMDIRRFSDQYARLKLLYSDLLSKDDINSIFLEDEHEKDLDYIKNKRTLYSVIWGMEILVLFIVVIILNATEGF